MPTSKKNTFKKKERLSSRILIDSLFQGDNHSAMVYPIRAVFMPTDKLLQPGVSILISVPKKRFHHAVDRNKVKRQIREAYRTHKHLLVDKLQEQGKGLLVAFVYVSNKIEDTAFVEKRLAVLLDKIGSEL